jgi:thiol-disulfide isomerase/thioredoxin
LLARILSLVANPVETRFLSQWTTWLMIGAAALVLGAAVFKDRKPAGPAPALTLPRLGGGTLSLEKGKVTVIDFWATWCAPCRVSMPRLQKLWKDYTPKGVALLSVDTDDRTPDREPLVQEFLLANGLTFPVALDDGSGERAFRISNLPTLVVVGKDGRILWRTVGALDASGDRDLRVLLDEAVAEK